MINEIETIISEAFESWKVSCNPWRSKHREIFESGYKAAINNYNLKNSPQNLFDKIKHGDDEHKEWLRKELSDFFKVEIN